MPIIRPFAAVRPSKDKVHLVASRSYVSYTPARLREKLDTNPFSFIHIINPDYNAAKPSRPASTERFLKVKQKYQDFLELGVLTKDKKPNYYIYTQTKDGISTTGIICGVSIDDYLSGKIKIHEQTLTKRESLFKSYLETTGFNAEPVLLAHDDNDELDKIIAKNISNESLYDFTTANAVRHSLWLLNAQDHKAVEHIFGTLDALYIADGHHRSASSVLLGQDRRKTGKTHAADFFMALNVSKNQLHIYEYNRLVKDLNGLTADQLLSQLSKQYSVEEYKEMKKPTSRNQIGLVLKSRYFLLELKDKTPIESTLLDATILTETILDPVFNIKDLKTDKRISFAGGKDSHLRVEELVQKGKYAAGFILVPVSYDQLKAVADAGETMPPKSTWVEPKLRSGLTIFELD